MTRRAVSFRLLKSMADPVDSFKENQKLEEIKLADGSQNKRLFAGQSYNNLPSWISFFSEADKPNLHKLSSGQAGAVLFVKAGSLQPPAQDPDIVLADRWLAICFGLGFQSLRPEALESQFGLRVALNRLAKDGLKSVDTRRPEDATIQTRSQNSRIGEIFDFGVDANHIILQAITGKSSDSDFGGSFTGSDGLKLTSDVDYSEIDDKVSQILEAYGSLEYRDLFPWYGNITPIKDRATVSELDLLLFSRLRDQNLDGIHLAPPEIVDYQTIDAYKFSGEGRGDGHYDLRLNDYLALFGDERPLSLDHIKSDKVRVSAEGQRFFDRWTIYKCLSAEIEQNGILYVLASGDWYAVHSDFVARINSEISEIELTQTHFPGFRLGEKEDEYNIRARDGMSGVHLFDKTLFSFEGERGRIEFCDLLTDDRKIIHVKKRDRSSLLSHLFMQGIVAAEAFVDSQPFRLQIRHTMPNLEHIIPQDVPVPEEYEIVFALLHNGESTLPFFSKVALSGANRQLRRMRYNISLAWIGPE
jgi:uncharacterized protein (TIGR04141 family)